MENLTSPDEHFEGVNADVHPYTALFPPSGEVKRQWVQILPLDRLTFVGYALALPTLFWSGPAFWGVLLVSSAIGWLAVLKQPGWSGHCPRCGMLHDVSDQRASDFVCQGCGVRLTVQDGRFQEGMSRAETDRPEPPH